MKQLNQRVKSLCAVFLTVALLFSLLPTTLFAQEGTTNIPTESGGTGSASTDSGNTDNGKPFVYMVEIVFGSFAFYYDWGTWNVSNFSYEKDLSSTYPAADTVPDKAGWYGFGDGNNLISVTNHSSNPQHQIEITIEYTTPEVDFVTFPLKPGCVQMDFYDTDEFHPKNQPKPTKLNTTPNVYTFLLENPKEGNADPTKNIYLSLSGEPLLKDGTPYKSPAVAERIGFVEVTVGPRTEAESKADQAGTGTGK